MTVTDTVASVICLVDGALYQLSEQDLTDCSGCNLPNPSCYLQSVVEKGGINRESCYPFRSCTPQTCNYNPACDYAPIQNCYVSHICYDIYICLCMFLESPAGERNIFNLRNFKIWSRDSAD